MKITIEPTTRPVLCDGEPVGRIWEGTTESGIPVVVLVSAVAVHRAYDQAQFERELVEWPAREPSEDGQAAFPSFP